MLRVLLEIIVPLVLPLAIYVIVLVVRQGRPPPAWWRAAPWPWLAGGGVLLMALSLGAWAVLGGNEPGAAYEPPRIEGGRIVPGHTHEPARP